MSKSTLLNILINSLEVGVNSEWKKFVENTLLFKENWEVSKELIEAEMQGIKMTVEIQGRKMSSDTHSENKRSHV